VVAISVFVSSPFQQAFSGSCLVICALMAQLAAQPFDNRCVVLALFVWHLSVNLVMLDLQVLTMAGWLPCRMMNWLQAGALMASLVNQMGAVLYWHIGDHDDTFSGILLTVNLVTLAAFLACVIVSVSKPLTMRLVVRRRSCVCVCRSVQATHCGYVLLFCSFSFRLSLVVRCFCALVFGVWCTVAVPPHTGNRPLVRSCPPRQAHESTANFNCAAQSTHVLACLSSCSRSPQQPHVPREALPARTRQAVTLCCCCCCCCCCCWAKARSK